MLQNKKSACALVYVETKYTFVFDDKYINL